jgi:hypothetical protein
VAKEDPAKRFVQDTAEHKMTVLKDDGLYRHLRFQKPGTWFYGFDLITWPGYLAMVGDMGEYVFSRADDMIEFFSGRTGNPNIGYWSEKLLAPRSADLRVYKPAHFRCEVYERLKEMKASRELRAAVREEVLSRAEDGRDMAISAAMDFVTDGGWRPFEEAYEWDVADFKFQYLWALHAIAWGADVYLASKAEKKELAA